MQKNGKVKKVISCIPGDDSMLKQKAESTVNVRGRPLEIHLIQFINKMALAAKRIKTNQSKCVPFHFTLVTSVDINTEGVRIQEVRGVQLRQMSGSYS